MAARMFTPRGSVTIATGAGPRELQAELYGPFAIHECYENPSLYTVTQCRSGLVVVKGQTYANAKRALRVLEKSGLDWGEIRDNGDLTLAHKRFGKTLRARFPIGDV